MWSPNDQIVQIIPLFLQKNLFALFLDVVHIRSQFILQILFLFRNTHTHTYDTQKYTCVVNFTLQHSGKF